MEEERLCENYNVLFRNETSSKTSHKWMEFLGKKECGATGNICAWIYLFTILEESEKIVTYKDGRKLVGSSGYSNEIIV